MAHFPESNEAPPEPRPETVFPNRPPQLNPTVCSCRCTFRSTAESDGDDGDEDDGASTQSFESTLVASNQSDTGEDFPPSSDGPEQHVSLDTFEVELPFVTEDGLILDMEGRHRGIVDGAEGIQVIEHVIGMGDHAFLLRPGPFTQGPEEYPDSMRNEPHGSDDHSIVSSEFKGLRSMSPGPGIAGWIGDAENGEYYFLGSPLRLTHQRQYCRGLVASHLVLHDG